MIQIYLKPISNRQLRAELLSILEEWQIITDPRVIREQLAIPARKIRQLGVVALLFPKTENDLCHIIELAGKYDLSLSTPNTVKAISHESRDSQKIKCLVIDQSNIH